MATKKPAFLEALENVGGKQAKKRGKKKPPVKKGK